MNEERAHMRTESNTRHQEIACKKGESARRTNDINFISRVKSIPDDDALKVHPSLTLGRTREGSCFQESVFL